MFYKLYVCRGRSCISSITDRGGGGADYSQLFALASTAACWLFSAASKTTTFARRLRKYTVLSKHQQIIRAISRATGTDIIFVQLVVAQKWRRTAFTRRSPRFLGWRGTSTVFKSRLRFVLGALPTFPHSRVSNLIFQGKPGKIAA